LGHADEGRSDDEEEEHDAHVDVDWLQERPEVVFGARQQERQKSHQPLKQRSSINLRQ